MRPYPLEFQPVLKQIIWGGRKLGDQLCKPIGPESDYAESWEVVDHGDDQSVVSNGPLAGRTLAEVIAESGDWLLGSDFSSQAGDGRFPLLLKYLDCNRVLSVQVHPDDRYGLQMAKPDLGKTEAWYIVSADPGSVVYAGLKAGVDSQALQAAIDEGRTEEVLHSFHPSAGDVVFIPAGTVHALGAGLLVAEIQQSSDTTFRLYDWDRMGADGKPRPLHIQQAIEVTDYESGPVATRRCDAQRAGWQAVVECDKFVLQLLEKGSGQIGGDGKFHILTVPRGEVELRTSECVTTLKTGMTVVLPALMDRCTVEPKPDSTVFAAHLPD
ncbi:MAG: type I phosphomannose isomerase catalytic subunit [Rubripirellula sp.]